MFTLDAISDEKEEEEEDEEETFIKNRYFGVAGISYDDNICACSRGII